MKISDDKSGIVKRNMGQGFKNVTIIFKEYKIPILSWNFVYLANYIYLYKTYKNVPRFRSIEI